MPNYKLTLEYDGTCFPGWHKQKNQISVSEELLNTLRIVLPLPIEQIYGSGRTDAGVHARGQVANFHYPEIIDCRSLMLSVSSILRGRLAVLDAELVPDDFHARYSVVSKTYTYQILNRPAPVLLMANRVWHIPKVLNFNLMKQEALALVGAHDFTSFRASNCGAKNAERTIYSLDLIQQGDLIVVSVTGNGFLKQMVRNIVGTLADFGMGSARVRNTTMQSILLGRDRQLAGQTAPPEGLFLECVNY